jgi:hypothetical protein
VASGVAGRVAVGAAVEPAGRAAVGSAGVAVGAAPGGVASDGAPSGRNPDPVGPAAPGSLTVDAAGAVRA